MAIKEYKLMGIKTSQNENQWTDIYFNGHLLYRRCKLIEN